MCVLALLFLSTRLQHLARVPVHCTLGNTARLILYCHLLSYYTCATQDLSYYRLFSISSMCSSIFSSSGSLASICTIVPAPGSSRSCVFAPFSVLFTRTCARKASTHVRVSPILLLARLQWSGYQRVLQTRSALPTCVLSGDSSSYCPRTTRVGKPCNAAGLGPKGDQDSKAPPAWRHKIHTHTHTHTHTDCTTTRVYAHRWCSSYTVGMLPAVNTALSASAYREQVAACHCLCY